MLRIRESRRTVTSVGLVVSFCLPALLAQDALHGWRASTATGAIELVAVEEASALSTFSFKNTSGRLITAFAVSFPVNRSTGISHYLDCFDREGSCLAPGTIYRLSVDSPGLSVVDDRVVEIRAAIFADGTSEGTQAYVNFIHHDWLGRMLEVERIKSITSGPTERYVGDIGIAQFTRDIGKLPESVKAALDDLRGVGMPGVSMDELMLADKGAAHAFLSGVRMAREDALRKVEQLRRLPEAPSNDTTALTQAAFLTGLRQTYQDLSAKHHEFLERRTVGGGRQ